MKIERLVQDQREKIRDFKWSDLRGGEAVWDEQANILFIKTAEGWVAISSEDTKEELPYDYAPGNVWFGRRVRIEKILFSEVE